jgi:hypothetical protein
MPTLLPAAVSDTPGGWPGELPEPPQALALSAITAAQAGTAILVRWCLMDPSSPREGLDGRRELGHAIFQRSDVYANWTGL